MAMPCSAAATVLAVGAFTTRQPYCGHDAEQVSPQMLYEQRLRHSYILSLHIDEATMPLWMQWLDCCRKTLPGLSGPRNAISSDGGAL